MDVDISAFPNTEMPQYDPAVQQYPLRVPLERVPNGFVQGAKNQISAVFWEHLAVQRAHHEQPALRARPLAGAIWRVLIRVYLEGMEGVISAGTITPYQRKNMNF